MENAHYYHPILLYIIIIVYAVRVYDFIEVRYSVQCLPNVVIRSWRGWIFSWIWSSHDCLTKIVVYRCIIFCRNCDSQVGMGEGIWSLGISSITWSKNGMTFVIVRNLLMWWNAMSRPLTSILYGNIGFLIEIIFLTSLLYGNIAILIYISLTRLLYGNIGLIIDIACSSSLL